MKDLVRIMEGLGFEDIRTYIQSGNVVFQSPRLFSAIDAGEISDAIHAEFEFRPDVMLLEPSDLEAAIEGNPFEVEDGRFLHFYFLESEPAEPDLDFLESVKVDSEEFSLDGKVFYLHARAGIARSKLAENVERRLGVRGTGRNLNTVTRLVAMVRDLEGRLC